MPSGSPSSPCTACASALEGLQPCHEHRQRDQHLLNQGLQVIAHLPKSCRVRVAHAQVAESVGEAATHQELHRQVVDALGILVPGPDSSQLTLPKLVTCSFQAPFAASNRHLDIEISFSNPDYAGGILHMRFCAFKACIAVRMPR